MAGGEDESRSIEETPTWAVATICFFLIVVSIFIEHAFHILAKYFNKRRRKALIRALDQIKSELMMLGFISLMLTVLEKPITKICIPKRQLRHFLPCGDHHEADETEEESKCERQGKISLISGTGIEQLQYLIFVLAIFHVLSAILTFSLGMLKMRTWEAWEAQTRTLEYKHSNDPRRFQFAHQTSFGRRHLRLWSDLRLFRLPVSFLRQFYNSVSRVDYLILRHGFIMARFGEGSAFDFQKYLKKALEKDFGVVVTVSPWIWFFSILFIFFSAHTFRVSLWFPFIPLVMLLVVGTKLQGIITKMGIDSNDKSLVVRGTLLVKPSDHFFWFNSPKLLLHLIHFILVQNSFQLAFTAWSWYRFGVRSCFHPETADIVTRIVTGVLVQLLCGYVTLPLYALVTQMGTSMRKTHVFPRGVLRGLRRWQNKAKKNIAKRHNMTYHSRRSLDASLETSLSSSTSVDSSFALELDQNSVADDEFVEVNIMDEGEIFSESSSQKLEKLQTSSSFQGFHRRNSL